MAFLTRRGQRRSGVVPSWRIFPQGCGKKEVEALFDDRGSRQKNPSDLKMI